MALLRYEVQFQEFITKVEQNSNQLSSYNCRKIVSTKYLRRHIWKCILNPKKTDLSNSNNEIKNCHIRHRAKSQTLLACADAVIDNQVAVRLHNDVLQKMAADKIGLAAKKDWLIRKYGETYLKKLKRIQLNRSCSNKMRKCAWLLLETRKRLQYLKITFFELLRLKYFDIIVCSARKISNYKEETKTFGTPSLAMHLGTMLK